MKIVLVGRGGLLTKIALQQLIQQEMAPSLVLIQENASNYPNLTKHLCQRYNIPYIVSTTVQSNECVAKIESVKPDLIVVASLGEILKKQFLKHRTVWNVHMGVLPYFKGPFTNFWLIKQGSDLFGCTIHEIDEGIDTGAIIKVCERDFTGQLQAFEFIQANYQMAAETLVGAIRECELGQIRPVEQDPTAGKYYPKHTYRDLELGLHNRVDALHRMINRLQFYGVPWMRWEGKVYKVLASNLLLEWHKIKDETAMLSIINSERVVLSNHSGILELLVQESNDY